MPAVQQRQAKMPKWHGVCVAEGSGSAMAGGGMVVQECKGK